MSNAIVNNASLQDIANAIRAKTGTAGTMLPSEMAGKISAIPGSATLTTKNITQNGTYNASSDNADGYSSVTVSVSGGAGIGLLWTNSSPTDDFAAQTVSIDLSNYDAVIIESKASKTRDNTFPYYVTPASGYPNDWVFQNRVWVNKGESGYMMLGGDIRFPSSTGSPNGQVSYRSVTVSASGVTFSNGYIDGSNYNSQAIPVKIYGVKGTLPTT